jgi:hypothetical protein
VLSRRFHPVFQPRRPAAISAGLAKVAIGVKRSVCAHTALLGRRAEEEPGRGPHITGQHLLKRRIPGVGEQGRSVLCRDFPWACSTDDADVFQLVEASEHGVGTLEGPGPPRSASRPQARE